MLSVSILSADNWPDHEEELLHGDMDSILRLQSQGNVVEVAGYQVYISGILSQRGLHVADTLVLGVQGRGSLCGS